MFRWCPAVPCVMAGRNQRHLEVASTGLSAAGAAGRQGLQVFLLFFLALLFRRTGVNHADGLHPPSCNTSHHIEFQTIRCYSTNLSVHPTRSSDKNLGIREVNWPASQPTPRSTVLPEKQTVPQPFKKFHVFY